jgi:hypothetical protein
MASGVRVGVEMEWEGIPDHLINHDHPMLQGWRVIPDGSLRDDGIEFVFRNPAGGANAQKRISDAFRYIQQEGINPICSERTSIHVHIDVRDMEWEKLWKMIVAYSIVEPYLFQLCGEHRAGNIYCLSLEEGSGQIPVYRNFRSPSTAQHGGGGAKYAALNFGALAQFGSLEFRGHEGTNDPTRILLWMNTLLRLREWATSTPLSVEEFPGHMSRLGPQEFLSEVFQEYLVEVDRDVRQMVYAGVWASEELLHRPNNSMDSSRLHPHRVDPSQNPLVEAFGGIPEREEVRARVPQAFPFDAEGGSITVPAGMEGLRIGLTEDRARFLNDRHSYCTVSEDRSIDVEDAIRVIRTVFGSGADITPTSGGLGRLGEILNADD